MALPEPFIIKLLGTKLEIVPYYTKDERRVLRYRVTVRSFAPPSANTIILTPTDMQALLGWTDTALAINPPHRESTNVER